MPTQTITKSELAQVLSDDLHMTRLQALKCVDSLFHGLREAVLNGGRIEIRGFGAWKVKETKPRPNARNPRTGVIVSVPAKRKVMFRPGKELKVELGKPV